MSLKQFRDPLLDTSGDVVGFYPREFYVFDNFAAFQVTWRGRQWPTSEHAYQAAHFFDTAPEVVEQIYRANSPDAAYKIANANEHLEPKNWADIKVAIMYDICHAKLQQNPYVQRKLLQTADLLIVEDSPVDSFWGWGADRQGRNELGKIWMRLREEVQRGELTTDSKTGPPTATST